jgi:transposase
MGRPTKLQPERVARLLEALREGNYYRAACAKADIGFNTFRAWMKAGQAQRRGKFREFLNAVRKAEGEAQAEIVAQWRRHCPENWQACRDFLARRNAAEWGQKDMKKLEHSGGLRLELVEELADGPGDDHPEDQAPPGATRVPPE